MILWITDHLTVDPRIKIQLDTFMSVYCDTFEIRQFKIEREVEDDSVNLINITGSGCVGFPDTVRMILLYMYGGIWFDLDSMFIRDMSPTFEYEDYVYAWEWQQYVNSEIFRINKPKDNVITQIVKRCGTIKSCHPVMVFNYNMKIEELYILPCYMFDPLWGECTKDIPNQQVRYLFDNYDSNISLEDFFPNSYVYHWHNKWSKDIKDYSLCRIFTKEFDNIIFKK